MMTKQSITKSWRPSAIRIVAAIVLALAAVCAAPAAARAATVEVGSVDELIAQIKLSREASYTHDIVLTNDIDFSKNPEKIDEIISELGSLTFGSKDHPFKGSFDGGGHYIVHLDYRRNLWKPAANTGLFSFTDGAYIHDIHFRNCYIGADYCGGVLVGRAKNTRIESVRMVDCTMSVTPANNAVSLITNAGLMGGMIAGEMTDGSRMYDCTVQGGRVVNNSVIGVSGLGGEGLYLGALVGSAENSEIEYCRVLPNEQYYADRANNPGLSVYTRDAEGNYLYQTEVYNRYEVAVGAVAGQGIYAGGVVGYTNDTDVVDCFSTAWVHTWVANYVGVGSGNIGYVGGIIAHAKSSNKGANASQVIRCHYAGNMESFQWNSIAVIPIIQSNVYLAGLVERDWEEDTYLENAYFKRNDIVGRDSAIKPHPKGYVRALGDWLGLNHSDGRSAEGFGYGPIVDDAKYADRTFWEGENYDFEGDELRYSKIDNRLEPHVNKWVMDDYLGIPVHGASIKATLDFPGAGSVTMEPTSMGARRSTSDPYDFAVQAVSANETALTLKAETVEAGDVGEDGKSLTPDVSDERNRAYRFMGWYRQQGVTTNRVKRGSHAFFDPIVPAEPQAEQVSTEAEYTAKNSGTGGATAAGFKDNDLFVAYYQAQVLFHDVNGNVIDKNTSASEDNPVLDDDWYNHQEALPVVTAPVIPDGEDGDAQFLGWTTERNPEAEKGGSAGWTEVSAGWVSERKEKGKFFEGGEPIERPMDLYPVYTSAVMENIVVVAEGHELDSAKPDLNEREGVLKADVKAENGKYVLYVQGYNADGSLMPEGKLPDGYRFLGWYEVKQNEKGEPVYTEVPGVVYNAAGESSAAYKYEFGRKLSNESPVVIPDGVDLTQKHYYFARFEYRVDYYAAAYLKSKVPGWQDPDNPRLYTERWKTYCSSFDKLQGPVFFEEKVDHWSLNKIKSHVDQDDATTKLSKGVVSHYDVYGHNVADGQVGEYDIVATFDFPNSARIHMSGDPWVAGTPPFKLEAELTDPNGFGFIGWSWIKEGKGGIEKGTNPWKTGGHLTTADYAYEAHIVAHVTFVDGAKNEEGKDVDKVVNRAYSDCALDAEAGFVDGFQRVFIYTDSTYTFRFQDYPSAKLEEKPNGLTADIGSAPTKEYMQGKKTDKLFLGWIDKYELAAGTMTKGEYERLYDEATRTAKVSIDIIEPYLVKENRLCDRPMTLYPVYADYGCKTTTNITRGTALTDPADPTIAPKLDDVEINKDGTKTVTASADVDQGTAAAYELTSWTIERPEGTVIETFSTVDENGRPVAEGGKPVSNANATLSYDIIAGTEHVIVANYKAKEDVELDVVYHVRPAGEPESIKTVKRQAGDLLGKAPAAHFAPKDSVLVGWSEQKPAAGSDYLMFDAADQGKMVDELTVVEHSMELWPVYRVVAIGGEGDKVDVRVNSNIDTELGTTSHRRAEVKVAEGAQGKQAYVALVADPVGSYKFLGWYKDYKGIDDGGNVDGVPVAGNRVTGDEVFAGNLYTAVYQKMQVYTVVYHFPDGKTSTVEIDGDDPTKFVDTVKVQKPVLDENGNPTFDADGNPIVTTEEQQATVVGGEQTAAIEGALEKVNNDGRYRELFCEWEWKKGDDSTVPWEDFCGVDHDGQAGKGIVEQLQYANATKMDLYPVTHRFNARDDKGAHYDAKNLVWQIDPGQLATEKPDETKPAVKIAFGPDTLYTGSELTIHMDEVHYAKGQDGSWAASPVNDRAVALYDTFDFSNAKPLDVKLTGHLGQDRKGDAVFTFDTAGSLVIEKTAPASAAGSTFTFLVTECNPDGTDKQDAKSAAVVLTAVAQGDTAQARAVLNLPWGYYRVQETGWGWRYTPGYQFVENGMTVEGRPENVVLIKSEGVAKVTNALTNNNYLDGEARTKNVFGQGATVMSGGAK